MKFLILLFLILFNITCWGFEKDISEVRTNCIKCHTQSLSVYCNSNQNCTKCHKGTKVKNAFLSQNYFELFIQKKRNPHNKKYLCVICHNNNYNLKKAEDEINLCEKCHDPAAINLNAHSYNFKNINNSIKIPEEFPLKDQKVVCTTCHLFSCKNKKNNKFLLRKSFAKLELFCFNCHDINKFHKYNPHRQIDEKGKLILTSCTICHTQIPDLNKDKSRRDVHLKGKNINELCNGCHQIKGVHPTGTNHLKIPKKEIVKRIKSFLSKEKIYVPFGKNYQILCVTCHLPHQYELLKTQATGKYKPRTRFNTGKELCIMCHAKD